MFDSTIGKAYMNAVIALVGAMLLTSTIIVAPTVTRGWGFGMMDGNESATSQDNSQAAIFTQNQLNCLNPLDDGWWSPIAGPVVVKVCVPPAALRLHRNLHLKLKVLQRVKTYRRLYHKRDHLLHRRFHQNLLVKVNLIARKAQQLRHRLRKREHQHHHQM
jgi:hypothetical protein